MELLLQAKNSAQTITITNCISPMSIGEASDQRYYYAKIDRNWTMTCETKPYAYKMRVWRDLLCLSKDKSLTAC